MLGLDFSKQRIHKEQEYSLEDNEFLKIKVSQEIRDTNDCHYETPLSLRIDHLWFPENKEWVIQREHWLRNKLVKS